MLAEAKAYAAGIGIVVVLAILGYFIYSYDSGQKKIQTQAGQIAVQGEQLKDQADTIELKEQAGQITADVVAQHHTEGKQTDDAFEAIGRKEQAEIQAIRNQPKVQPVPGDPLKPTVLPPVGVTPEEAQVSLVRINALWEGYCVASPQADGCKKS